MSYHRKAFIGMSALALAVSTVFAAPTIGPGKMVEETPGMTRSGTFSTDLYNHGATACTGFETSEGWDLDFSICGAPFGPTCIYPVSNVCIAKNHAASQNCCPGDPNENTGWCMSPSGRHCTEPSIRNINPSHLKDPFLGKPSLQHVRFQYDPAGGLPAGCTGTGSACRERFITSQAHVAQVADAVAKYDIAISNTLGMNLVQFWGQDTAAGSINLNAYTYWYYLGGIYIYSHVQGAFAFGGYWSHPDYVQYVVDLNPCTNIATYSYGPDVVFQEPYGFSPPFGDQFPDLRTATTDTAFFTTDSFPPETIDIDNYCVTQTPCSWACCGKDGICLDQDKAEPCVGASYPNTLCSSLGTKGYPATCHLRTGSCCNHNLGAGGACTDGVLEAGCTGDQFTWVQGGACTAVAGKCDSTTLAASLCDIGGCTNWPNVGKPCATAADCTVTGFCFAGTCSDTVPTKGCQGDWDCTRPPPAAPSTCVKFLGENGGKLCMTDADCNIAASACAEHTGACCTLLDGRCQDGLLSSECLAIDASLQPVYHFKELCADVEARGACDAELGACCDHDTFGGCTDTTFAGCQGGKLEWTKGATCATLTVACLHEAIPTVSTWGLAVLTLLLLVGAKVYFGRRQNATA